MDAYTEQLVIIKKTPLFTVFRILLWFIDISSSLMLLLLALSFASLWGGIITTVLFVFIFMLNYMVIILNRRFNVEYEYLRTDNFLDIDRIFSGKSRERLATVNLRNVEKTGNFSFEEKYSVNKKFVCANPNDNLLYIIFNHTKYGKTLIAFSPDERLTEALKIYIPRQVWNNEFGRD